jgi:hypothetical protein
MQLRFPLRSDHYRKIDFRLWNIDKCSGFNQNKVMAGIQQYMNKRMSFDAPIGLSRYPHNRLFNNFGGLSTEVNSWYGNTYHNPLRLESMAKHAIYSRLTCGVYFIWCGGMNIYIGQTERPFQYRWEEHAEYLESGTHHCSKLQECFDDHSGQYFHPMIAMPKSIDRLTLPARCKILKFERWAIDHIVLNHNTL